MGFKPTPRRRLLILFGKLSPLRYLLIRALIPPSTSGCLFTSHIFDLLLANCPCSSLRSWFHPTNASPTSMPLSTVFPRSTITRTTRQRVNVSTCVPSCIDYITSNRISLKRRQQRKMTSPAGSLLLYVLENIRSRLSH